MPEAPVTALLVPHDLAVPIRVITLEVQVFEDFDCGIRETSTMKAIYPHIHASCHTIEPVYFGRADAEGRRPFVAWVDECGWVGNPPQPWNVRASLLTNRSLAGNAVVHWLDKDGNPRSVPDEACDPETMIAMNHDLSRDADRIVRLCPPDPSKMITVTAL